MSPRGIFLENEFLQSAAFIAIRSKHAIRVLLEFYRRRKIHKPKGHRGKRDRPVIVNNGEIELRYRDAIKRLNISQATFSRCLTELVELGFLDIAVVSCGLHRQATKWTISERWKAYGTPDFKIVKRVPIKPPFVQKRKTQLSAMNTKTEE
ncbi:MAG: hypothetical protein DRP56_10320 [Planctomycetota bacterium]|nr:MAG: hypothetical protein DRP56_10320 [Planctomycetota bacterium]